MTSMKNSIQEFAIQGGPPVFEQIKSISNLVQPDFEKFLGYSTPMFRDEVFSGAGAVQALLEKRLAEFHQVAHCVSLCGGFWGLVLTMKHLALPGRNEVIMPSLTYRRLADIVAWAGLTPRFCEVDPQALCITEATAQACVSDRTALILGVHPIVNCCDAFGLEALSARTGIPLMFDAVESAYETLRGRKVGSFGRAECFSMQSSKLFNAFEGGYVTTNDTVLADSLRSQRNHGLNGRGEFMGHGMNANQSEVHAAMALAALDGVHAQVEQNRARYQRYQHNLQGLSALELVPFDERERHGYKNIVVKLTPEWPISRELTLRLLHKENMLCRAYYSPPLHQKATGYDMVWDDLSLTEALAERYLMLPCGYFVSIQDVDHICNFLADIVRHGQALKTYEVGQ
ncbi:MAG: aminotransferase class I/II-fold pyridoxal phosphate-dependent enzyme [Curvibacter sp.]|nr:aminotransferase class I/II-fold pyridoxal phosphate-dependent enzyme [Curvibacter sp.]